MVLIHFIRKIAKILDILKVRLMKVFTSLPVKILVFCHSQEEELRSLMPVKAIRTQHGNGLISHHWFNTTIITIIKLRILVMRV